MKKYIFFLFCFIIQQYVLTQTVVTIHISSIDSILIPYGTYYGKLEAVFSKTKSNYTLFDFERDLKANSLGIDYTVDDRVLHPQLIFNNVFYYKQKPTIDTFRILKKDTVGILFCFKLFDHTEVPDRIGSNLTMRLKSNRNFKISNSKSEVFTIPLNFSKQNMNDQDSLAVMYIKQNPENIQYVFPYFDSKSGLNMEIIDTLVHRFPKSIYSQYLVSYLEASYYYRMSKADTEATKNPKFYSPTGFDFELFEKSKEYCYINGLMERLVLFMKTVENKEPNINKIWIFSKYEALSLNRIFRERYAQIHRNPNSW